MQLFGTRKNQYESLEKYQTGAMTRVASVVVEAPVCFAGEPIKKLHLNSSVDHGSSCQSQSERRKGGALVHLRRKEMQEVFPISQQGNDPSPAMWHVSVCHASTTAAATALFPTCEDCDGWRSSSSSENLFHCLRLNNRGFYFIWMYNRS